MLKDVDAMPCFCTFRDQFRHLTSSYSIFKYTIGLFYTLYCPIIIRHSPDYHSHRRDCLLRAFCLFCSIKALVSPLGYYYTLHRCFYWRWRSLYNQIKAFKDTNIGSLGSWNRCRITKSLFSH